MGQPVVHFEVIGKDGGMLQRYYAELFGWQIDADNPLNYGAVAREGSGIGGGSASGPTPEYPGHVTFYVEVPDVGAALAKAESLGERASSGRRRSQGPTSSSASSPTPKGT